MLGTASPIDRIERLWHISYVLVVRCYKTEELVNCFVPGLHSPSFTNMMQTSQIRYRVNVL